MSLTRLSKNHPANFQLILTANRVCLLTFAAFWQPHTFAKQFFKSRKTELMKGTLKILAFGFILTFGISTTTIAQKYGHLNVGNLLELLPEVTISDSLLAQYRDSLVADGQSRAAKLEARAKVFFEKRNAGDLTPLQQQEQGAVLQKEQEELQAYEQEAINKVQQKRQEFLEPILKKVNDAIQSIGKENNYSMIFDTSVPNTVLFVEDTDDLMPLVLKKLGVEVKE